MMVRFFNSPKMNFLCLSFKHVQPIAQSVSNFMCEQAVFTLAGAGFGQTDV